MPDILGLTRDISRHHTTCNPSVQRESLQTSVAGVWGPGPTVSRLALRTAALFMTIRPLRTCYRRLFPTLGAGTRPLSLTLVISALAVAAVPVQAGAQSLHTPSAASLPSALQADAPPIRVQLKAKDQAVLSSQLAGRLTSLPFKAGQRFARGDLLAAFDCDLHQARLSHARAAAQGARKKAQVARKLNTLSAISQSDYAQAQSNLSQADAEIRSAQAMVRRCEIRAPYAGRVKETYVEQWEYVPEGTRILAVFNDTAFEVEMIVPSRWLVWLKPGFPFRVHLDETGQTYQAEIDRLAAGVDPVSQSIQVFGRLDQHEGTLLPGMSGEAQIIPPETNTPAQTSGQP